MRRPHGHQNDHASQEQCHQRQKHIGYGACQRRERHARLGVAKPAHIDGHWFCPAKVHQGHHNQSHQIHMLEGIEGEPSHALGRIIAHPIGGKAMAGLVHRDAKEGGKHHHQGLPDAVQPQLGKPLGQSAHDFTSFLRLTWGKRPLDEG